jgi:predicted ATPase
VNECSRELVNEIRQLTQKYAVISQALDASFPRRFLSASRGNAQPTEALLERLNALQEQRRTYRTIGLMRGSSEDVDTSGAAIDENKVDALAMMISDMERKLRVFGEFQTRVTTLIERVNAKFRNKSLSLSRVGLSLTGSDGQLIKLSALSSGEQHELVLLYELLFKVEPNSLVLIDEPELSLHLQWQKSFMSDLLAIVVASRIDVVLATHSPYITGDRFDLMEPLDVGQD